MRTLYYLLVWKNPKTKRKTKRTHDDQSQHEFVPVRYWFLIFRIKFAFGSITYCLLLRIMNIKPNTPIPVSAIVDNSGTGGGGRRSVELDRLL